MPFPQTTHQLSHRQGRWPHRFVPYLLLSLSISTALLLRDSARAGASRPPTPNILIILTDDQKADWSSGNPLQTTNTREAVMPQTEARLMSQGVTFRNAFVTNPVCCPSRASILTGTYSHTNGVWSNSGRHGGFAAFDDSSTLATWFDGAGYRTGYFGKYLNGYRAVGSYVPPGWDRWFAHVQPGYFEYSFNDDGQIIESGGEWAPVVIADEVVRFIADGNRPFFAIVAPFLPHKDFGGTPPRPHPSDESRFSDESAYRVPSYNERDVDDKPRWVQRRPRLDSEARALNDTVRLLQYRTLYGWDREIARILEAVEATGELTDTIIVFLSDNGYQWGEHRLLGKNKPYDGSARVPLFIRYDAKPLIASRQGTISDEIALNIDIAPTVARVAGIAVPDWVEGENLLGVLRGSVARRRFAIEHARPGGPPPFCGIRTPDQLFIRYSTGEEEFYDYRVDPWEEINRAGRPGVSDRVDALRNRAKVMCAPPPPGFSW